MLSEWNWIPCNLICRPAIISPSSVNVVISSILLEKLSFSIIRLWYRSAVKGLQFEILLIPNYIWMNRRNTVKNLLLKKMFVSILDYSCFLCSLGRSSNNFLRERVTGGLSERQNSARHNISTPSLSIFANRLGKIIQHDEQIPNKGILVLKKLLMQSMNKFFEIRPCLR